MRKVCIFDASTITLGEPNVIAVTVQITALYGRPPLPYEPVASITRLACEPKDRGQFKIVTGLDGLVGAAVRTEVLGEAGLLAQSASVLKQKALTRPPVRVTMLPVFTYECMSEVAPKVTETVDTVVHAQVAEAALMNVKSKLQGQVAATMPAESLGASNEITSAWPLLENRLDNIVGDGVCSAEDRI